MAKNRNASRTPTASALDTDLPNTPELDTDLPVEEEDIPDALPDEPVEELSEPVDETPPEAPVAPVVEEAPPFVPDAPETAEDFVRRKHQVMGELPLTIRSVIKRMENYVTIMNPRCPVTPSEGAVQQRALYTTYQNALATQGGEHRLAIDAILWYFRTYRHAALSERTAFRFIDIAKLLPNDAIAFNRLTHLFIKTADPQARRQALRSIDMRQVVEKLHPVTLQQQLLDYYL